MKRKSISKKDEMRQLLLQHPGFSPFVLLKLSMLAYGAVLTPRAERALLQKELSFGADLDPQGAGEEGQYIVPVMGPVVLRDGTVLYIHQNTVYPDPYFIEWDANAGAFYLMDGIRIVDEIGFMAPPAFFQKRTSSGLFMRDIAYVYAQCLHFPLAVSRAETDRKIPVPGYAPLPGWQFSPSAQDLRETVEEALREPGSISEICISVETENNPEENYYLRTREGISRLQGIFSLFTCTVPSQLIAGACKKEELCRIKERTGIRSYSADLLFAHKEVFDAYCPYRAAQVGYEEWLRRLIDAVSIFGRGNVYTRILGGAELAGEKALSQEEALDINLRVCEFLAQNGVIMGCLPVRPGSERVPELTDASYLSYITALSSEFLKIHRKYGLVSSDNDYRHGGMQPDADLERMVL